MSIAELPLKKWFVAIYYMKYNSKGISSVQLARQIGVSQQTAWFMYHRIRETYKQNSVSFTGTVEVDETFVGGKEKINMRQKRKESFLEKLLLSVLWKETLRKSKPVMSLIPKL